MSKQNRTNRAGRRGRSSRPVEPYSGTWGRTRMESVHFALPSGELASVRLHTVVNATTDPALAERLLRGELNWVQPMGLDALEQVSIPVVYHDESLPVFALVLPESFRARELAERRILLERLEEERGLPLPEYVRNFQVVYGADGLTELLAELSAVASRTPGAGEEDLELAEREDEIVAREAALLDWEERLAEQERALQSLQEVLERRQEELDALEQLLHKEPVRPAVDSDSPTRVANREKMERAARRADSADEEETLDLDGPAPNASTVGASAQMPQRVPEGLGDEVPGASSEAAEPAAVPAAEMEADAGGDEAATARESGAARQRKGGPTPLAQAVLEATEAASADQTAAQEQEEAAAAAGTTAGPAAAGGAEDLGEAEQAPPLPPPLHAWAEQEVPEPIWYLEDGRLHLCVSLQPEEAEAFIGTEPVALLQVHSMPTYPLVTLGVLASEASLLAEDAYGVFWPFDVAEEADLQVLKLLAEDFRLVLSVYDTELEAVTEQELHFPLEENARIARERALALLDDMPAEDRDQEAALAAFGRPDYGKFATEPLPFSTAGFQELETAADVAEAARVVAQWSTPESEEDLLLLRSFPAAAWRSLRLRVLRAAIDLGVWLEPPLRRIALEAGFATSRRDLLRASLTGFEQATVEGRLGNVSPQWICENWDAMLQEAERLNVVVEPRWEALAAEAREALVGAEPSGVAEAMAEPVNLEQDRTEEGEGQGDLGGRQLTEPLEQLDESDLVDAEDLVEDEAAAGLDGTSHSPEMHPSEDELDPDEEGDEAVELVDAEDLIVEEHAGEPLAPEGFDPRPDAAALSPDDLGALSLPELVVLLGQEGSQVAVLQELAIRGDARALPEMFGVLDGLDPPGLAAVLPALAAMGEEAEPYFVTALRSGNTALRLGSAAILGCLASARAEDGLVDLLMDEPTDRWTVVADALAALGEPVVMALASRLAHSTKPQRERIAHAMARVAVVAGCRSTLVGLSRSRDEVAAAVASEALSRHAELSLDWDETAETPEGDTDACIRAKLAEVLS